jgi:N-acetyl-anhydromuramyl-L-alanine amidase AmpD
VIHNGGWDAKHNINTWSCRPSSAHYSIQRDGAIYQNVGEELVAWHAGGKAATDKKINDRSIGIELNLPKEAGVSCNSLKLKGLSADKPEELVRNACTPTDAQYESLNALLKAIAARTSVTVDEDHVIGHCKGQNPSSGKAHGDPKAFDWSQIGLSNDTKKTAAEGTACK